MRIEEIKKYIADDGNEFDNEGECTDYEQRMKGNAEYMLGNIPHHIMVESSLFPYCGSETYGYLFVMCSDYEEVTRFKEWLETYGYDSVDVVPYHTMAVEVYFNNEVATLKGIENVNEVYSLYEFVHRLNRPFFLIENKLMNWKEYTK